MELKVVARAENGFSSKFGIPRQSGLVSAETRIVFEPEFRSYDALRGVEQFSHLWLIWGFSEGFASSAGGEKFSPTVRPPRLGGNTRVGVFATRSPNRPNRLGLSAVKLLRIEKTDRGPVVVVSGADLLNGTPIYDIKPYIPYSDAVPEAVGGFADGFSDYKLGVKFLPGTADGLPEKLREEIREIVSNDPRPSYQDDPEREYFFEYGGCSVGFRVRDRQAEITRAEPENTDK